VTIVTTNDGERDVGLTANSFNSVSLDPPLVLWSLAKTSGSLGSFKAASHFAVHILAADQQALSNSFAQRGADKFAGVEIERGAGDAPLLVDCCARFQCRSTFEYDGGDHIIFVGEVVGFDHAQREPLLFHSGQYAAAVPSIGQIDGESGDLSYLVQCAYFNLLTPVRKERIRLGLSLHDHYVLNVLMDGAGRTVAEIDDIISYTGLRAEEAVVESLRERELLSSESAEKGTAYRLAPAGRDAVISLLSAARAVEVDVASQLTAEERATLKRLLRKIGPTKTSADPKVARHMELMRQVSELAHS
jgi:3-hydroxy-9,10-secoandrosta-1,3,5(10)-triene-9,17-dione monooxygenase reductase component